MKEEELRELVRLTEMSLKFKPVLNPKQFNVFHKFLDKARQEGRQSQLKEELEFLKKIRKNADDTRIYERIIKIEKELSGVKGCGKFIPNELSDNPKRDGWVCGQYYDALKRVIFCSPECQENEDTEEEIQLTDFGNRIADKLIKEKEKELAGVKK